jgi:hypothetical protein
LPLPTTVDQQRPGLSVHNAMARAWMMIITDVI